MFTGPWQILFHVWACKWQKKTTTLEVQHKHNVLRLCCTSRTRKICMWINSGTISKWKLNIKAAVSNKIEITHLSPMTYDPFFFTCCFVDSIWFHYLLWTPADPGRGPDHVRVLLHLLLLLYGWNRLWVSGRSTVFTGEKHGRWCVLHESHSLSVGLGLLVRYSYYCYTAETSAISFSKSVNQQTLN